MLNRLNRLKKRYQFNYVYKSGEFYSQEHICLHAVSSKTKNIKVGFAVTKKIGHAVVRNRVRRQLREILQKHIPNLKQNYNIIVVAKENITQTNFQALCIEMEKLLTKANLFKDEENI